MSSRVIVLLLALAAPLTAAAQTFRYTFTGTFYTSAFTTAVRVNDTFSLSFDLNYATTDSQAGLSGGAFMGAVSNLSFSLTGGTGNYAGGSMSGSQFLQVTDYSAGGDLFSFYATPAYAITGLAFPAVDGHAFSEFGFNLQSVSPSFVTFSQTTGQTLGSLLGGNQLLYSDFQVGNKTVSLIAEGGTMLARANITGISASAIPEPSTYAAIFGVAALGLAVWRRRNRTAPVQGDAPSCFNAANLKCLTSVGRVGAILLAILFAVPSSEAQSLTLLSNIPYTDGNPLLVGDTGGSGSVTDRFATGSTGYFLHSVSIPFGAASANSLPNFTLKLYSDGGGNPGVPIFAFNGPSSPSNGTFTYSSPLDFFMTPGTSYWIQASSSQAASSSKGFRLMSVPLPDEISDYGFTSVAFRGDYPRFFAYSVQGGVSAIPEPSTYALIMGGVTIVGAALWRRRQSATA